MATGESTEPEAIPEPDIDFFDADDDAGTYYCIASNPLGAIVSNAVVLVPDHTNVDRDPTGKGSSHS